MDQYLHFLLAPKELHSLVQISRLTAELFPVHRHRDPQLFSSYPLRCWRLSRRSPSSRCAPTSSSPSRPLPEVVTSTDRVTLERVPVTSSWTGDLVTSLKPRFRWRPSVWRSQRSSFCTVTSSNCEGLKKRKLFKVSFNFLQRKI